MAGADGLDRGDATRPFEESVTYGDAVARLLSAEHDARATIPALTIDTDRSSIEVPTGPTSEEDTDHFARELSVRVEAQMTTLEALSITPYDSLDDDTGEALDRPTGVSIAEGDPVRAELLANLMESIAVVQDRVLNPGRPAAESDLRFRVGEASAPLASVTTNIATRPASRLADRQANDDLPVEQMSVNVDTSCRVSLSNHEAQQIAASIAEIVDLAHDAGGSVKVDSAHVACAIVRLGETHRLAAIAVEIATVDGDSVNVCMASSTVAPMTDIYGRKGVFLQLQTDRFNPHAPELASALTRLDPDAINAVVDKLVESASVANSGRDLLVSKRFRLVPINTNFDRWMSAPVELPDGMSMDDVEGLEDYDVDPNDRA